MASTEYLTLIAPASLSFTVECWIFGNAITGDFIIVNHDSSTLVLKLSVSSNDLVLSSYGGSVTFTGAKSSLSSGAWNSFGISFGILGDSTNQGIACLWINNQASSSCLTLTSISTYYSTISLDSKNNHFIIGNTFTGTIG